MRTNYVLIDYENVQPPSLAELDQDHFKVLVLVGANQKSVSFSMAAELQKLGNRAQYIQAAGTGKNALDFHLAYYLGKLAAEDPTAYFHIISKDTGFDTLVAHLHAEKISVARSSSIAEMPAFRVKNALTLGDKAELVITKLQKLGNSKPRTEKTLLSTIHSLFEKRFNQEELERVLTALKGKGVISIKENKVTYNLPAEAK